MLVVLAVAVVTLGLSACSANVTIAVDARANGTGVVVVSVVLDRQAVATVGGLSQLQTADLTAAGWQVAPPAASPNGSETLTASHAFTALDQVGPIVDQIGGSGPVATRPFQFALIRTHSFWKTTTRFEGKVDLTCGVSCFGDSRLTALTGSSTGIDPTTAAHQAGVTAAGVFHFNVNLQLPGAISSTNGASTRPGSASWQPALGDDEQLVAVMRTTNSSAVITVAVAVGAVVVVLLVGVLVIRHRRRRRRRRINRAGPRRAHARR